MTNSILIFLCGIVCLQSVFCAVKKMVMLVPLEEGGDCSISWGATKTIQNRGGLNYKA